MRTTILQQLLEEDGIKIPKGTGAEHMILCFIHSESDPSMSVNIAKGVYFCHGCGAKGNAYTYLTEVRGLSSKKAWKKLEQCGSTPDNLEFQQTAHKAEKQEQERERKGLPRHTDRPYETLAKDYKGKCVAVYKYLHPEDNDDQAVIVQRWHEIKKDRDGKKKIKKTFITYTPCTKSGGYWVASPNNEDLPPEDRVSPIPLYGIQEIWPIIQKNKRLPDMTKHQIWVVEGEKCRDGLAYVKDHRPPAVVSPYGGSQRPVETMDWSPLFGERVALLADADKAGRRFMLAIGKYLTKNGAECRYFLPKGDSGYDVYDALQDGGWNSMIKWIQEHGGVISHKQVHSQEGGEKDFLESKTSPLENCQFFTVLGYRGDDVLIQSKKTHYLHEIPARTVGQEGQLIRLAPLAFWKSLAPNGVLSAKVRAMWADMIVREAEEQGAVSVDNLKMYERGAATTEGGEIVYNIGDCLLTENDSELLRCRKPLLFSGQGREIFLPGPRIKLSDHEHAQKWADAMASAVLAYRWEHVEHGKSFLGWIVTSLIGGALSFRPVIWMIGGAGTGKTFLLDEVLKKLMGPILTDVGSGSEAGLASMSGCASLPFFIDEFEPEKIREGQIANILGLMRIASSSNSARLRSTASGGVSIRRPRFSLLLSSINTPVLDSASESRIVMVRLSETPVPNWLEVRDRIYAALTKEHALAIRTYIIRHTARVVRKAQELENRMIVRGMDTRMAKTQSALTAGYWLLSGQESEVVIKKRKEADNLAPLMAMMSKLIKADNRELAFAECLYRAYFTEDGRWDFGGSEQQNILRQDCMRYGFRFVKEDELQMALKLDTTRVLLAGSKYANIDVDDYVLNLPGVKRLYTTSGNPMRIRVAGMQKPAVQIPRQILEKLGFYGKDYDPVPDGNELGEDTPF